MSLAIFTLTAMFFSTSYHGKEILIKHKQENMQVNID